MTKQRSYNTFRQMFPEFVYESFRYEICPDGLHLAFLFRLNDKICFEPTAFIPARPFLHPSRLHKETLDTLVFHIGMIELISYWKCVCSPTVVVKPYLLDEGQVAFWKKLYFNGLGEFFYTNGIKATEADFMTIHCEGTMACSSLSESPFGAFPAGFIVPIGGGKDSVVSLEILTPPVKDVSAESRPLPLIMNPRGATVECVARAGYGIEDVIVINRTIHPRLLELNKQGCLNGHTPFSAMLAFYTLLASAMTGRRADIALSNENSANESTVVGTSVNHQYSKSLEFENDFRDYVARYISPQFNYHSFLRPLSELQIAMLFSRYPHYFDVFKSCNVGSKTDIWCGHCAKCLFAYIILSPFIEPQRLNAIFGRNMLDDNSLRAEFDQLRGMAETKPFECVGTVGEVNSALTMTLAKWYPDPAARPALLEDYHPLPLSQPLDRLFAEHNLSRYGLDLLKATLALRRHDQVESMYRYRELFNLLAFKRILIAGYGREGKSTHALLQRMFPSRTFDIAHNNDEILEALARQTYDLIFKSPGIPTAVFEGHCDLASLTSQTDIFLQVYGDQTVGVSGTKGKSTTANLIYSVLASDKSKRPLLAGNMGIPLFDILASLGSETTVVAELSCHQLETIHRSPHIAVLLNLFQEHLDHYHSYRDYQLAKLQIALHQSAGDSFYYCSDNEELAMLVEEYRHQIGSSVIPYSLEDAHAAAWLQSIDLQLQGEHNRSNAFVVGLAARQCGVSEEAIVSGLSHFKGLEHRMELVATVKGVTYYNDSISTIPQTAIAAIEALKEVDTLILGGFNRGIDYRPLADYLADKSGKGGAVRNLVLFGNAGEQIDSELNALGGNAVSGRSFLRHIGTDYSMEEAVQFAAAHTAEGKICLLSPAASSYDHYTNFEERGRHFKMCVSKL